MKCPCETQGRTDCFPGVLHRIIESSNTSKVPPASVCIVIDHEFRHKIVKEAVDDECNDETHCQ